MKVDLPQPLGPTSATRESIDSSKSRPSKTRVPPPPPHANATLLSVISGGARRRAAAGNVKLTRYSRSAAGAALSSERRSRCARRSAFEPSPFATCACSLLSSFAPAAARFRCSATKEAWRRLKVS